jgi:hypothetical protein
MKPALKPIIAALIFAALFIASAWLLKGNPAKDWVQSGLYGVGFYFLFRYSVALPKKCRVKANQK